MTLSDAVYSMVTIAVVLASSKFHFVESAVTAQSTVTRINVSSRHNATVAENRRILSTSTSFSTGGYCGYPDVANAWAEPLQECGSNAFTEEECKTNAFYDTTSTCKWDQANGCTSDAHEVGDFDPVCPNITKQADCIGQSFFGSRRCVWFEPPTSSPTISPSSSFRPSVAPSQPATSSPTVSPSSSFRPSVSPSQSAVPSENPTHSVVPSFTPSLSKVPTGMPTSSLAPTALPSSTSAMPSFGPSATPSMKPTWKPTREPTRAPTPRPTREPTPRPTLHPTKRPTLSPTMSPSSLPSLQPTDSPTEGPSESPTSRPSQTPTRSPTNAPSNAPTEPPSPAPTTLPSGAPISKAPVLPTQQPTPSPTAMPSPVPSRSPSDTTVGACICNSIRRCLEESVVEEASSVGVCLKTHAEPIVSVQDMRLHQESSNRGQFIIKDGNILSSEASISASSPKSLRVMIGLASASFDVDLPIAVEGEVRVGAEKKEIKFELTFELKSNGVNPLTEPEIDDDDNAQSMPVGDDSIVEDELDDEEMMMWLIPLVIGLVIGVGLVWCATSHRRRPKKREYTRDRATREDEEVFTTMA